MAFEDTISNIPFTPSTSNGRGFLPPLVRLEGHLLYLLGRLTDTPTRRPTDNQIREEIDSISPHLESFALPEYFSEPTKERINQFLTAFHELASEIEGWDYDTKITNLRMLTNRGVDLLPMLDREVLGIRDSDAGQAL